MPRGGSRTIRPFSQSLALSRNPNRNVAMAVRSCGRTAGFGLNGPHQHPSAEVGIPGQSPRLEAKDEAITCIPMPFGLKRLGCDSSITDSHDCGQTEPRLKRLGCDSSIADSHDGGQTEPRYTPTIVQQPPTQSPNQAPQPFTLSGDGCPGLGIYGESSRQEAESGLDGCTTVMTRRTPMDLTQRKVVRELHTVGPLTLSGDGCPGLGIYGETSRQETESGLNGCTTVMIRRTPMDLTQRKVVWELHIAGFADLFDYVCIPLGQRLVRPMVFVNFTSGTAAEKFYQVFNGRPLRSCCSVEPVFVIPASIQGFAQNLAHHLAHTEKHPAGRRSSETLFRI